MAALTVPANVPDVAVDVEQLHKAFSGSQLIISYILYAILA